jgi:hypothetical protein
LTDELLESVARTALTPSHCLSIYIKKITIVMVVMKKALTQFTILPLCTLTPSVPCPDPPGNAVTPSGSMLLGMNTVKIIMTGTVHSYRCNVHSASAFERLNPRSATG